MTENDYENQETIDKLYLEVCDLFNEAANIKAKLFQIREGMKILISSDAFEKAKGVK